MSTRGGKRRIRRAAAACLACRQRKVRCDATVTGRCTNCLLSGQTSCIIRPNNTPRFLKLQRQPHIRVEGFYPAARAESTTSSAANSWAHEPSPAIQKTARKAIAACYHCHLRKVRCDASVLGQPCTNCRLDCQVCTLRPNDTPGYRRLLSSRLPRESIHERGSRRIGTHETSVSGATPHLDPKYDTHGVLDLSQLWTLPDENAQLLMANGCFSIPQPKQLIDFVRQYLLFIHPTMPILDESQLTHLYGRTSQPADSLSRMSAFVLQAVLLATCPVCFFCVFQSRTMSR